MGFQRNTKGYLELKNKYTWTMNLLYDTDLPPLEAKFSHRLHRRKMSTRQRRIVALFTLKCQIQFNSFVEYHPAGENIPVISFMALKELRQV